MRELTLRAPPAAAPGRGGLGSGRQATMQQVLTQLRLIEQEDNARGLFLRIGPMGGAWGSVADLVEALSRIRAAGKPVHCHFDSLDNAGYSLAARACDPGEHDPRRSPQLSGSGGAGVLPATPPRSERSRCLSTVRRAWSVRCRSWRPTATASPSRSPIWPSCTSRAASWTASHRAAPAQ